MQVGKALKLMPGVPLVGGLAGFAAAAAEAGDSYAETRRVEKVSQTGCNRTATQYNGRLGSINLAFNYIHTYIVASFLCGKATDTKVVLPFIFHVLIPVWCVCVPCVCAKVAGMAPDAAECCSLARRVAVRLADGLADDAISAAGGGWGFRVCVSETA